MRSGGRNEARLSHFCKMLRQRRLAEANLPSKDADRHFLTQEPEKDKKPRIGVRFFIT